MDYTTLPLENLLSELGREGFALSPEVYKRVLLVVEKYFPGGLPFTSDGQTPPRILETESDRLRDLLCPVVARNQVEQKRFREIFGIVIDRRNEWLKQQVVAKLEKPPYRKIAALLIGIVLIAFIGFFIFKPNDTNRNPYRISTMPSGNVQLFFSDSLSALQCDSVHWSFDDGSPIKISNTCDTVEHTYTKSGSFKVTGVRFRHHDSPLGWLSDPIMDTADVGVNVVLTAAKVPEIIPTDGKYDPVFQKLKIDTWPTMKSAPMVQRSWAKIGWIAGILALIALGLWWWLRPLLRARAEMADVQPLKDPPYVLRLPDQRHYVRVSSSLKEWSLQLQQRIEGQRRLVDVPASIRSTALKGGMPQVQFRNLKQRPRYLALIDGLAAGDQYAKLHQFCMQVLGSNEVELDTFNFHADPRICWNKRYPQGIGLDNLFGVYGDRRLILLSDGLRLVDYDTMEVAEWARQAMGGWATRSILTPVLAENWNYREDILSRFYNVLPATPAGQQILTEYANQEISVSAGAVRQLLGVDSRITDRGLFGKTIDELFVADVDAYLETAMAHSDISLNLSDYIRYWAYATAVYVTPDWNATIAIGQALEVYGKSQSIQLTEPLVTTGHLAILTRLPWLRLGRIPLVLQNELLSELAILDKNVEPLARAAVEELLGHKDLAALPVGSIARQDLEVRQLEQKAHAQQDDVRRDALRRLIPYNQAGLIYDEGLLAAVENEAVQSEQIDHEDAKKRERKRRLFAGTLLFLSMLTLLIGWLQPAKVRSIGEVSPILIKSIYKQVQIAQSDSASWYNNKAATLLDSVYWSNRRSAPFDKDSISRDEQYTLGISWLVKSLQFRTTASALYNLHALRYNQALLEIRDPRIQNATNSANQLAKNLLNAPVVSRAVEQILAPLWLFYPGWTPDSKLMRAYLTKLQSAGPSSSDSLYNDLQNQLRKQLANGKVAGYIPSFSSPDKQEFKNVLEKARQAFNPFSITVLSAPVSNKAYRITYRKEYGQQLMAGPEYDSLFPIEAERMILYQGGIKLPVAAPPPVKVRRPPGKRPVITSEVDSVSLPGADVPKTVISGIAPEYGLLIGELQGVKDGENGWFYLMVQVGKESYRVAITVKSSSSAIVQSESPAQPVISATSLSRSRMDTIIQTLLPMGYKNSFFPLQKTAGSGALNLLAPGFPVNIRSNHVSAQVLMERLMIVNAVDKSGPTTVFVWGARRRVEVSDPYFGLSAGFYEMQDVHMNQGSVGTFAAENAPWQDGGVLFSSSAQEKGFGLFIYMSSQSLNVDSNGNPKP
ncbi:DUF2278 family protein [Dyadobacter jiangsuensis]